MTHIQLFRLRALLIHDYENLRHFVVEARSTGQTLGIGSYGAVEEVPLTLYQAQRISSNLKHLQVEINGVCAGKKIHDTLLDIGNIGMENICYQIYTRMPADVHPLSPKHHPISGCVLPPQLSAPCRLVMLWKS